MTTAKLKKTLETAKKFFHNVKNAVTTTKRVKSTVNLDQRSTRNDAISKADALNQIFILTKNLLAKKAADEESKIFRDNLSSELQNNYYLSSENARDVLNINVPDFQMTIAEIAEIHSFDAEQTLALYIGLKLDDEISAEDLIYEIDNGEFELYPEATNYEDFGREVFDNTPTRFTDEGVINAIYDTLDFEQFGRHYARKSLTVIDDFGAVVIF